MYKKYRKRKPWKKHKKKITITKMKNSLRESKDEFEQTKKICENKDRTTEVTMSEK